MNSNLKYTNRNAFEVLIITSVELAINSGVKPEEAYRTGRFLLDHAELLVEPRQHGVEGAGNLSNPYRNLDNRMRELGQAHLVEPQGRSAGAEISW